MHDLNAIRRLYGEPGEGPPEEGAELKAMADVKAALDRLPPRRPDPSVIDAVVEAAGEAVRPAALDPIRTIYGEEASELDSAAAESEARALAGMKAALDALPPQRPDASLIDAVVAAAGRTGGVALGPVRAVYEEEPEPLASEAAEAEAAALAEVKAALDRLRPRRPDPSVIDAVVAAVAQPAERPTPVAAVTGRAADRPARRDTRRRVAASLGTVFALVLVFGGGLWLNQEAPNSQEIAVADSDRAEEQVAEAAPLPEEQTESAPAPTQSETAPVAPPAEAEQLAVASPSQSAVTGRLPTPPPERGGEPVAPADAAESFAAESFAARAAAPVMDSEDSGLTAEGLSIADIEALALDGNDELRLLYLRLREMQAGQAGLGWDTPPVALGAAPDSLSAPAPAGWMQVRVQR